MDPAPAWAEPQRSLQSNINSIDLVCHRSFCGRADHRDFARLALFPNPCTETTSQRGDRPAKKRLARPLAACSLGCPGYSVRISPGPT